VKLVPRPTLKRTFGVLLFIGMLLSGCQNPSEGGGDYGMIVGRVINSQNHQPIAIGTVSVGSSAVVNLSTADQGGFALQHVPIGTQTLVVTSPGYGRHQEDIAVLKGQTSQAGDGGIVRLDPTYMSSPNP
jgi:hypothetical protein